MTHVSAHALGPVGGNFVDHLATVSCSTIFFALSWTLLLEGPDKTKSQKKKVLFSRNQDPVVFSGEKVSVEEMMKIFT